MSLHNSVPVYGHYDAIISGGGIVGLVCAVQLAQSGRKVALLERRSTLGWEIGQARRIIAGNDLSEAQLPQSLRRLINAWEESPQANQIVRAPLTELAFDRWALEHDIDVLFNGWSAALLNDNGTAKGVVAATREGYVRLLAPLVIETDDSGRLVDDSYLRSSVDVPIVRAMLIRLTSPVAPCELPFAENRSLKLQPLSDLMLRADIPLRSPALAERDREFHLSALTALQSIRSQALGGAGAQVCYLADEEWRLPAFRLQQGLRELGTPIGQLRSGRGPDASYRTIHSGDIALSSCAGLLLGGCWLPCYLDAIGDSEENAIVNRFLLGEALAAYASAV